MRRFILSIVTTFLCFSLQSQIGAFDQFSVANVALGNQKAILPSNSALLSNFSQLAQSKNFIAQVSANQRFNLSELLHVNAAIGLPIAKVGYVGLQVNTYGFDSFKESQLIFSYTRPLSEKVNIGARFGYYSLNLEDYGSRSSLTYEINFNIQINEKLDFGILIQNPENKAIHDLNRVNSGLVLGMRYKPSEKAAIFFELDKNLEERLDFKTGVLYALHERLNVMTGFSVIERSIGFGSFLKIREDLSVGVGASYHNTLGIWPVVTLSYGHSQKNL